MAATALDRGSKSILGKVSECLVSILAQAEMLGQLEGIKVALTKSFETCELLQSLDQRVKTSFVFVVSTLRGNQPQVKMALQTLNRNVQRLGSPDEFLGLEITAKHHAEKTVKQASDSLSQPEVIHI